MMDRETKSNDELREIFQNRIDPRTEKDGDHITMTITWHEPDENGCNWSRGFGGDRSWIPAVEAIGDELQSKYNLAKLGVHRD